jgi:hypothetical protein
MSFHRESPLGGDVPAFFLNGILILGNGGFLSTSQAVYGFVSWMLWPAFQLFGQSLLPIWTGLGKKSFNSQWLSHRALQRPLWPDELSMLTIVPSSVVILFITAYMILAWYLWQRHVFKGPRLGLRLDLHATEQYSSQVGSLQNESVAYSLVGGSSDDVIMKDWKSD